jgi:AcrR family transcriptional regulator
MSDAGLTHGGFYRHFSGKDGLYAAAVRQLLCGKTPAGWRRVASRVRLGSPALNGLSTPISRASTSTIATAAVP